MIAASIGSSIEFRFFYIQREMRSMNCLDVPEMRLVLGFISSPWFLRPLGAFFAVCSSKSWYLWFDERGCIDRRIADPGEQVRRRLPRMGGPYGADRLAGWIWLAIDVFEVALLAV